MPEDFTLLDSSRPCSKFQETSCLLWACVNDQKAYKEDEEVAKEETSAEVPPHHEDRATNLPSSKAFFSLVVSR